MKEISYIHSEAYAAGELKHGTISLIEDGTLVMPQALAGGKLNKMWLRRQTTKFNGVAYVVQRGAEAVFTDEGMKDFP